MGKLHEHDRTPGDSRVIQWWYRAASERAAYYAGCVEAMYRRMRFSTDEPRDSYYM